MSIFDKDLVERNPIPFYEEWNTRNTYIFESTVHAPLFYLDFEPWFENNDEGYVDEGGVSK